MFDKDPQIRFVGKITFSFWQQFQTDGTGRRGTSRRFKPYGWKTGAETFNLLKECEARRKRSHAPGVKSESSFTFSTLAIKSFLRRKTYAPIAFKVAPTALASLLEFGKKLKGKKKREEKRFRRLSATMIGVVADVYIELLAFDVLHFSQELYNSNIVS